MYNWVVWSLFYITSGKVYNCLVRETTATGSPGRYISSSICGKILKINMWYRERKKFFFFYDFCEKKKEKLTSRELGNSLAASRKCRCQNSNQFRTRPDLPLSQNDTLSAYDYCYIYIY